MAAPAPRRRLQPRMFSLRTALARSLDSAAPKSRAISELILGMRPPADATSDQLLMGMGFQRGLVEATPFLRDSRIGRWQGYRSACPPIGPEDRRALYLYQVAVVAGRIAASTVCLAIDAGQRFAAKDLLALSQIAIHRSGSLMEDSQRPMDQIVSAGLGGAAEHRHGISDATLPALRQAMDGISVGVPLPQDTTATVPGGATQ